MMDPRVETIATRYGEMLLRLEKEIGRTGALLIGKRIRERLVAKRNIAKAQVQVAAAEVGLRQAELDRVTVLMKQRMGEREYLAFLRKKEVK